jgi:hypothetical protein
VTAYFIWSVGIVYHSVSCLLCPVGVRFWQARAISIPGSRYRSRLTWKPGSVTHERDQVGCESRPRRGIRSLTLAVLKGGWRGHHYN